MSVVVPSIILKWSYYVISLILTKAYIRVRRQSGVGASLRDRRGEQLKRVFLDVTHGDFGEGSN